MEGNVNKEKDGLIQKNNRNGKEGNNDLMEMGNGRDNVGKG
jgi:hypothetical protein